MRILLLLITNAAVILSLLIISKIFGLEKMISSYGFNLEIILIFSSLFGFGGAFISLLISKSLAIKMYNIFIIDYNKSDDFDWFRQYTKEISLQNGIDPPDIGVYESPDINAFATGFSKKNSLIALSTGLINHMDLDEIKGVIGHEISHIANGDMVTMTLLQGVMNTFVLFFSRVVASVVSKNERFSFIVNIVITFVLEVIFGFFALIVINAFSRHREYRADAWCASKVGKSYMIKALEKLKEDKPFPEEAIFSSFRISNNSFFSTHPSIENRIKRLRKLNV
jgi:heat shock protein HtpX